jgi:cystathionine beta-synthase
MKYVNSMLELIGNTPLLKLNKVTKDVKANVFAKLEFLNPSGSYKDRMALAMVEAAEKGLTWNGKKLMPDGIAADASSGNTAISLAFVCAVKRCRASLCVYKSMLRGDTPTLKIIDAYGASICECRPPTDFLPKEVWEQLSENEKDVAWVIAGKKHMSELEKHTSNLVWIDQIYNKYNYIGQMKMGYEIYEQLDGKIDTWGCAISSAGTFLGVTLALKEKGVEPFTFGVEPVGGGVYLHVEKPLAKKGEFWESKTKRKLVDLMKLEKWQKEKSIVEEMLERGYPDEIFQVSDEEARDMANRLAQEEGIWCGISSGANVLAALKVAKRMKAGQNVVTVIVDRRDRYLGEYPNETFIV